MYFMRSLFGSYVILLTYYPLCLLFSYLFLKSRKRKTIIMNMVENHNRRLSRRFVQPL